MLESSTQPFSAATSSCAQDDDDDPPAADDNVLVLLLLLEKERWFFKNRFQDQPPQHTFSTDHFRRDLRGTPQGMEGVGSDWGWEQSPWQDFVGTALVRIRRLLRLDKLVPKCPPVALHTPGGSCSPSFSDPGAEDIIAGPLSLPSNLLAATLDIDLGVNLGETNVENPLAGEMKIACTAKHAAANHTHTCFFMRLEQKIRMMILVIMTVLHA
jgi:hypothetical protein